MCLFGLRLLSINPHCFTLYFISVIQSSLSSTKSSSHPKFCSRCVRASWRTTKSYLPAGPLVIDSPWKSMFWKYFHKILMIFKHMLYSHSSGLPVIILSIMSPRHFWEVMAEQSSTVDQKKKKRVLLDQEMVLFTGTHLKWLSSLVSCFAHVFLLSLWVSGMLKSCCFVPSGHGCPFSQGLKNSFDLCRLSIICLTVWLSVILLRFKNPNQ